MLKRFSSSRAVAVSRYNSVKTANEFINRDMDFKLTLQSNINMETLHM